MRLLPRDIPAELHRWVIEGGDHPCRRDVVVASGPLVAMAYGLMAIDPAERDAFWISSEDGSVTPDEAEEALRHWADNPVQ